MNRLILIGNGFDLAHGLKTSYHDFILDYLKKCLINGLSEGIRQDGYKQFPIDDYLVITIKNLRNFNQFEIDSSKSIIELKQKFLVEIKYRNFEESFFSTIINSLNSKGWIDIERFYYEELKKLYVRHVNNDKNGEKIPNIINRVSALNKQLDYIKEKLREYLNEHLRLNTIYNIREINSIIHDNLKYSMPMAQILLLNFNYTNLANKYKGVLDDVINIHGELGNNDNPIIFGYGDEVDKFYKGIEDLNENEFFKHIKSFDYLKASNYNKLLDFIETTHFEAFTMGHSLGLSDRTLLNKIFEHSNCKKIKIFYHNDYTDYRNKTYEMSRHFKDKASMREKIVPFPDCIRMPQHDDK